MMMIFYDNYDYRLTFIEFNSVSEWDRERKTNELRYSGAGMVMKINLSYFWECEKVNAGKHANNINFAF